MTEAPSPDHIPMSTLPRRLAKAAVGPANAMKIGRSIAKTRASTVGRLHPQARRSSHALSQMEGLHTGERCVIIGNGPSLKRTNMSLLQGECTFGLNRIYMLFEEWGWSTTYHVVVNQLVVEQCADDFVVVPGRLFTTWPNRRALAARDDDIVFLQRLVGPTFSMDARRGVWEGATVTFVAMQLAYFLGFQEVVLVGVDHRFADKGPAHKVVTATSGDQNHFSPEYFGPGFRWQLPDLETSELAYSLAGDVFMRRGGRVIDATVDGALQIFPKARLEDVLC